MKKKSPLKSLGQLLAAFVLFALTKLIYISCRKEIIRSDKVREFENSDKPLVYCFWHGRMYPMPFIAPRGRKIYTIISRHGDGELITNIIRFMGVGAIRGSTNRMKGEHAKGFPAKNRGGTSVIRESLGLLDEGKTVAITPDGPKGPIFSYKTNSIKIAAKAGVPILPMSFSCSNAWILKTWDKFILPKPFSKIKVVYGELKEVAADISDDEIESCGKELQDVLNNITTELDKEFNLKL